MREIAAFSSEGECLLATLDGPETAMKGWLFVVGGTQTRVGPHRLYERLAMRLAAAGQAVIRFDRRGVGDSSGTDPGYAGSAADLIAAVAVMRSRWPNLDEILGFGLCDGATALALHGRSAGVNSMVLANPWVVEPMDDLPPSAAIRGHYRNRLRDPQAWLRLLRGEVDLRKLMQGLSRSGRKEQIELARLFATGVSAGTCVVLADGDGTAQTFTAAWSQLGLAAPSIKLIHVATSSHSFADPAAFDALASALLETTTPPL